MLTNDDFVLTDKQLAKCNAWAQAVGRAYAEEEVMESFEIKIVFSFSQFGREIHARCGQKEFALKDLDF